MTSLSRSQSFLVCLIVAAALFMELIDGTVITTALPAMGQSFHVNPIELSIGITAYLLTEAVFIPISSWVADRYGARSVFVSALGIFTVASVLCGLCSNVDEFVAARVMQGIGGAMMVPVGRMVVLRTTEKKDLIDAMSLLIWPALVAPILGPPLGGFITTYWSWHWIFFVNVPLGLAGIIAAFSMMPELKADGKKPFDIIGFVLIGATLACIMLGLDRAGTQDGGGLALCTIAVGIALGSIAVVHIRRHPHPILDLWSLRVSTFAATLWGGSLFRIAIGAVPFLIPLMLQVAFGLSALAAGTLTLWIFVGNLCMKVLTSSILRRFGFRFTLIVNGLATALSIAVCAMLLPTTPHWVLAIALCFGGLCRSMQFTAITTLSFADIPPERMSGSSALGSLMQQVTNGVGVAIGALVLHLAVALHGHSGKPVTADFHLAFLFLAVTSLAGLISYWRLRRDAGANVSGKVANPTPTDTPLRLRS